MTRLGDLTWERWRVNINANEDSPDTHYTHVSYFYSKDGDLCEIYRNWKGTRFWIALGFTWFEHVDALMAACLLAQFTTESNDDNLRNHSRSNDKLSGTCSAVRSAESVR